MCVQVTSRVTKLLEMLDITEHAKTRAAKCSGGTRRKLSVAMALIGAPEVLMLDEPSTGMDPASRRNLWKIISANMADRSAILTTHSMEVWQPLCCAGPGFVGLHLWSVFE